MNARKNIYGAKGLPPEMVAAMWADYQALGTLVAVGRKWQRKGGTIRGIFLNHGLRQRDPEMRRRMQRRPRTATGGFAPARRRTAREITAIIGSMKRLVIPRELQLEWRLWPLARRADFIRRVRAKLRLPTDRPTTPFSPNVEPFDYASERAQALIAAANAGRPSRYWVAKIDLKSQGVIYRDQLYFWVSKRGENWGGYYKGPWRAGVGRPCLHHVIWEETHGRPVPARHTVILRDGNRNNFNPDNLALRSMADCALMNSVMNRLRDDPNNPELLAKKEHIRRALIRARTERSRAKVAAAIQLFKGKENNAGIKIPNLRAGGDQLAAAGNAIDRPGGEGKKLVQPARRGAE